jgi:hypothetical protein
MNFITLIDCSQAIEDTAFKELYLSKLDYLEKILMFFDNKGIEATVNFYGEIRDHKLQTYTEVICRDEEFKQVLEKVLRGFDSIKNFRLVQPG